MFPRLGSKKGFTLVELVIVLVIIAILVALALPRFTGARRRAYRVEALQVINEIKTLAWARNLERGGNPLTPNALWPENLGAIGYVTAPTTTNWTISATGWVTGTAPVTTNFVITATPIVGKPAEGQANVVLTIKPDGTSTLQ